MQVIFDSRGTPELEHSSFGDYESRRFGVAYSRGHTLQIGLEKDNDGERKKANKVYDMALRFVHFDNRVGAKMSQ